MVTEIFQVDAFTNKPFGGNPAGVCLLSEPKSDKWMQNVSKEMNASETAFLLKKGDKFSLRWFTPTVEVDLCGHATLASAHVLWEKGYLAESEPARFQTKSGLLTAERNDDWIRMNFPMIELKQADIPEKVVRSLGVEPKHAGQNQFDYLIEVDSEQTLRKIQPDFHLLKDVQTRGVIVTSQADSPDYDIVSRFFCPAIGVNEDPVTGSAHCCLAPYWGDKLGQNELTAYQASERGGILRMKMEGDRVHISGQAVTVLEGKWRGK